MRAWSPRRDVRLPHQAFADQEGVHAGSAPAAARSAGVAMPLSAMTMRSFGTRGASRSVVSSVVSKVLRSRLLMPIRRQSS